MKWDAIANLGVLVAGMLVLLTRSRFPDVVVGAAIRLFLIREAVRAALGPACSGHLGMTLRKVVLR